LLASEVTSSLSAQRLSEREIIVYAIRRRRCGQIQHLTPCSLKSSRLGGAALKCSSLCPRRKRALVNHAELVTRQLFFLLQYGEIGFRLLEFRKSHVVGERCWQTPGRLQLWHAANIFRASGLGDCVVPRQNSIPWAKRMDRILERGVL
jgi:hypothetical protein